MTSQVVKNKRRGRRTENKIADKMGAVRQGLYGQEDAAHPIFSIEVKDRKKFTGKSFMDQAIANAPTGKVPIVIVHVTGDRHDNDLVMIRMKDWQKIVPNNITGGVEK